MREAVDTKLRDNQAGFCSNWSKADQITSLRIIVEQSLESNSPFYVNFIDFEKAFDSVERETLWKLLRHFGARRGDFHIKRIKRTGCSSEILKRSPKRYQDPVLWAWLEFVFHP